jgi:hypothetical protein
MTTISRSHRDGETQSSLDAISMSGGLLTKMGDQTMCMKGSRRKAGRGTPEMDESVMEAVKNGIAASAKNTLTFKLLESVGINSKCARCFCISSGLSTDKDTRTLG